MDYLELTILATMLYSAIKRGLIALIPIIFSVFPSCTSSFQTLGIKSFVKDGWDKDSVLTFHFKVEAARPESFDLIYQLKVNDAYPFQNIWLKYHITGPTGQLIMESKDNLFLFDPKTGKSYAPSALGTTYATAYFLRDVRFSQKGNYTIQVQHYMRTGKLKGVESLAVLAQPR